MRVLSQDLSLRAFLTIGPYEEDEGFRAILRSIAQNGLFIYGLIGTFLVVLYVAIYLYFGKEITWTYVDFNKQQELLILDKILIFFSCLAMIPLSKSSLPLNWIRFLVYTLVWFISIAILVEDIAGHDTSFTTYTTIILLFAVVMVPSKGWHVAILALIVITSTALALVILPGFLGLLDVEIKLGQIIFIFFVAFILTGMSSQIYNSRYEQFLARQEAEELSKLLEQRALVLEKLKEKSENQAELLRENEKLKDRFFANISHDFRTPLTLILGPLQDMLNALEEGEENIIDRGTLSLMNRNGQKLLDLINQLLELSKIDAGKIQLHKQPTVINNLLQETVASYYAMAEAQKVALSLRQAEQTAVAYLDPQMTERAIGNLITNAIKFTSAGGEVEVLAERGSESKDSIHIIVQDTGIGIPKNELPYVFDRFYQVAQSPAIAKHGTGIGLSFTQEVVQLQGGSISVSSEYGKGSRFEIILPLSRGISSSAPVTEFTVRENPKLPEPYQYRKLDMSSDEERKKDAPTVMLIDDNPDILAYLHPHLEERYRVILLEKSSEALKILKNRKVDLILSDVMMPAPDGFELCRMVKEDPEINHIPVILLTAQAEEESKIEGLELGADDYISKPFNAAELMVRAENLIELRRTLRNKFSQQVHLKGEKADVSSEDARFLQQVQSAIEEHMSNTNFGVDWLADEVNLSARQLQRKIRAITDLSAGGYIRMLRLERAEQLLSQEWGNVSEIAYEVGFQDARYFSRLFKQTFGKTPTNYIANNR